MTLVAEIVAYEVVKLLKPVAAEIARHDSYLADQARRAGYGIALNVSEGLGRVGKDRLHHWRIALGSARELEGALRIARDLGYAETPADLVAHIDRAIRLLWGLTARRAGTSPPRPGRAAPTER